MADRDQWGGRVGGISSDGGRGAGRVGVDVTADRGGRRVAVAALLGAAELSVSEVLAHEVVEAGEGLELVEVLVLAAELSVAALLAPALTLTIICFGAVSVLGHAPSELHPPNLMVPVADFSDLALLLLCALGQLVLGAEEAVVLVGVADVLEASVFSLQTLAITVIDAAL